MPWYLYTGNRVQSIPTGYNNTVAVPPYGRVEIHQLTQPTQAMLKARPPLLRPCGAPAGVEAGPWAAQVAEPAAVLTPSAFAGYFTEGAAVPAVEAPLENVSAPAAGASVGEELPPVDEADAADGETQAKRRRNK